MIFVPTIAVAVTAPVAAKKPEPAKKWRNRWRATKTILATCVECGDESIFLCGEVFENHCAMYPSKDVAETAAARGKFEANDCYLGAFPVTA